MFNNDDNYKKINIEKIAFNDDILNNKKSFKEEEDCDEYINGDNDSENSEKIQLIIII